MPDRPIVILHGWSDTSQTFEPLARLLRARLARQVSIVSLADYVSMEDEVRFDDVAEAMDVAWRRHGLPRRKGAVDAVVHSTGGLVIRDSAIRKVHKYSGDASYRSVYVDCTRLARTIDKVHEALSLSITAYPELDERTPVGFTTLGSGGRGGVRIPCDAIARFFAPHRTALVTCSSPGSSRRRRSASGSTGRESDPRAR